MFLTKSRTCDLPSSVVLMGKLGKIRVFLTKNQTCDLTSTNSEVDLRKLGKNPSAPDEESNL